MGSICSSVSTRPNHVILHAISSHTNLSLAITKSPELPVTSIHSGTESSLSNSSGFQVYPHFSAIYDVGKSSQTNHSLESPMTPLKEVHPVMCRLPGIADYDSAWKQMLTGQLNQTPIHGKKVTQNEDRVIYIYHCANYGDSVQERLTLQSQVYPTLKEYCSKKGVTLEVIDLTQGLSHYSAHGHACKKMSQKILGNLMSQKLHSSIVTIFFNDNDSAYFYPLQIKKEDFHLMLRKCTQDEKHFLLNCYKLDNTLMEPSYVVQDFNFKDGEKTHIRLRNIFSSASAVEFQRLHHVSDVERSLSSTGIVRNTKFGNKIWIKRNFTDVDWDQMSPKSYRMYRTDDTSNTKRTNFTEVLSRAFEKDHTIHSDVKWSSQGVNPALEDHEDYLKSMADRYSKIVMPMLAKMIDAFENIERQKIRITSKGLTEKLYVDILHQTDHALKLRESVFGQDDLIKELENYVTGVDLHGNTPITQPLVLRGPPGSGKSAIASLVANNVHGLSGWKNSCCVMKSAQASLECVTLEQMVYCLAEQLCVLSAIPIRTVYQQKYNILHHLLNPRKPDIFPSPNLLIIIDGLDDLDTNQMSTEFCNLVWLPMFLPKHVRMVITTTTDSDISNTLQKQLPKSNIKDVPRLFMADALSSFSENMAIEYNRYLPYDAQQKVMLIMRDKPSPLFINLLTHFLNICPNELDDLVEDIGRDCEQLLRRFIQEIETCFGLEIVRYICCLILVSRHGVSCTDLNILCQNDLTQCELSGDGKTNPKCDTDIHNQTSQVNIYMIVDVFMPFLRRRTIQGVTLMKWGYSLFQNVLTKRYGHSHLNVAQQKFQSYLNGLYSQGELVKEKCDEKELISPDHLRAFNELPYCYHISGSQELLLKILTSPTFVSTKIKHCGIQHLLMDFHLLQHSNTGTNELNHIDDFVGVLKVLEPALLFNPETFELHLSNYNFFCDNQLSQSKSIFAHICEGKRKLPQLETGCCVDNFSYGYQNIPLKNYTFSELYHIKDDTDHMIGLATDNNEMQVINIHTGEPHRTLRGIEKPRVLRAINMLEMVVLCDREMRIYNVDQGTLLSTLKGVLNLSLPCFEVKSEKHTMAVSRNRMHINMYNNSTGDVCTTFKVGENRFLNSLLVSENGEYCVCGDEVRKPFPLLVWDLKHSKLIHDLRITGHEFITKVSALTKDGSLLVCASSEVDSVEPSFLLVYEVQNGTMFTKLQAEFGCTAVAISKEANHVVSAYENGDILVWHLSETVRNTPKFRLHGHVVGIDKLFLCENGNRGVTYDSTGRDPFIWMWDFKQGTALGCVQALISPSCCQISADGHTLIVCYPGLDKVLTFYPPETTPYEPNTNSVYGDASRKAEIFYFNDGPQENI